MPFPLRIDALLAKAESVYGTDSVPTVGSNGIRLSKRLWPGLRPSWAFRNERDDVATGTLVAAPPASPVGHMAQFAVPVEIRGPGAAFGAASLPEADPLLLSLFKRSDTFPTQVEYSLADSGHGSFSAYAYCGGFGDASSIYLFKLVGCRVARMRIPFTAGLLGTAEFECQGLVSNITFDSIPAPTYSAVVPPPVKGLALTIGGSWTPNFQNAELVVESGLQRQDSGNAADAIREFAPSGYGSNVRFRVTAETLSLSTYSPYTIVSANTSQAIAATLGSAQYNRMDLVVAASYLANDPEPADFNGFAAWNLEYILRDLILRFD